MYFVLEVVDDMMDSIKMGTAGGPDVCLGFLGLSLLRVQPSSDMSWSGGVCRNGLVSGRLIGRWHNRASSRQ